MLARAELAYLLVASLIRIARLAEVGDKVQHSLGDAHVLATVVLRKVRLPVDQRQPEYVRQILAANAAQALRILALLGLVAKVEQVGFGAASRVQVADFDQRGDGVTVAERLHR